MSLLHREVTRLAFYLLIGWLLIQSASAACQPGTFVSGSNCEPCTGASYSSSSGLTSCSPTDLGYEPNTDRSDQEACLAGYFRDELLNSCRQCDPGTFSNETGSSACYDCEPGTFASFCGSTGCTNCLAGTYEDLSESAQCKLCDPPAYAAQNGATLCSSCSTNTHFVSISEECEACAYGYYRAEAMNPYACAKVPIGYEYFNDTATICEAGKYQYQEGVWTRCSGCAPGTYQPEAGASTCITCPGGMAAPTYNSTVCTMCSAGKAMDLATFNCTNCPVGYSRPTNSSLSCSICEPGTYAASTGASVCAACQIGRYSAINGATVCTSCSPGTFVSASSSVTCNPCPQGMVSVDYGSSTCAFCAAGYFANSSSSCSVCPAGTYRDDTGADNLCRACEIGFATSSSTGATSCVECEAGYTVFTATPSVCTPCPAGTQEVVRECEPCALNEIALEGSTSCTVCGNGTYPDAARTSCSDCDGGFIRVDTDLSLCYACDPGSYAVDGERCELCAPGTYASRAAQTACTDCAANSFSSTSGYQTCTLCPIDFYTQLSGSTVCIPVPSGFTTLREGGNPIPISFAPALYAPGPDATNQERDTSNAIGIIVAIVFAFVVFCFLFTGPCLATLK